jgi:predicted  nucleic acid-binding Zn-ribbon protein
VSTSFDDLDQLASLDEAIARLTHGAASLPAAIELAELGETAAGLARQRDELAARRQPVAERLAALEAEVAHLDERRRVVDDRLRSATGGGKDLLAMDAESTHLKERTTELEDVELSLMEELEPIDTALDDITSQLEPIDAAITRATTDLAEQRQALDAEIAEQRAARSAVAATIEPSLLARYERAAVGARGAGAARLVDGRCTGCHLQLPSAEVDRLRHLGPEELASCEQCGRLLLRSVQLES